MENGLDLGTHLTQDLPSAPFKDAKRRLAKAVLLFQDKFVDLRVDSGSLVQVGLSTLPAACEDFGEPLPAQYCSTGAARSLIRLPAVKLQRSVCMH